MTANYLIVGQGLAGSVLALTLLEQGQRVHVLNTFREGASSAAAAGLFNPVTGRVFSLTWRAAELFPFLHDFYRRQAQRLGAVFLHEMPIFRPFADVGQQNQFAGKSSSAQWQPFVGGILPGAAAALVRAPHGGVCTRQSGYLDVPGFLAATRRYLQAGDAYTEAHVSYADFRPSPEGVRYAGQSFARTIFCEGHRLTENSWFNWLPLIPNKGEIISLRTATAVPPVVFNRGVWMVPRGNNGYRAGSTFENYPADVHPTAAARTELDQKVRSLYRQNFEVTDQQAGIRPTTRDRRPFLGVHPAFPALGVFNGLGTKGVSLAPYWAAHLATHLITGQPLDPEVNINRYLSLYEKSATHPPT